MFCSNYGPYMLKILVPHLKKKLTKSQKSPKFAKAIKFEIDLKYISSSLLKKAKTKLFSEWDSGV